MFLHQLTPAQRRAFARLAQLLIRADHVVDIREEAALHEALREMGLPAQELPPAPAALAEVVPELTAFETLESRRILILELVVVICSDREADPREVDLLRELCDRLDMEDELVPRCHLIARDHHELMERGRALISPEWDQSGDGWVEEEEGPP